MSLLRRIERRERESSDRDPQPPRSISPPMRPERSSPLDKQWQHQANGKLFAVTLSPDKRFVIAGSQQGEVVLLDSAGRLLWTAHVAGAVHRIAMADQAQSFVISTLQGDHMAYHWHYSGRLLRTYPAEDDIWGLAITPDASRVITGSLDGQLCGFDHKGVQVFKRAINEPIRHLALTPGGDAIFAGTDDHRIHAFDGDGEPRWQFATEGRVYAGVRVAAVAGVLVAGSNDGCVYGLDLAGNQRWRYQTSGTVNALAITPDGRYCAAGGNGAAAYLLNDRGEVLWDHKTEQAIYGLALSPDGRFTLIGANDSTLQLIDHEREHKVWHESADGRVYAVAMSDDAQCMVAASADHTVYFYQHTGVDGDGQELTRPASKPHCKLVIQVVRREYTTNPHAGLVRWFSEYEQSLRHGQFDVCQALLEEIHQEDGFNLSEGEHRYTHSLEGAYWLFRGVAHHRLAQYAEARACYEQSKAIQDELNNRDGTGQVIAALSLLPEVETLEHVETTDNNTASSETGADATGTEQDAVRAETRKVLAEITSKPRVLGTSETLLAHRLTTVQPVEQLQILLLARQFGYAAPLLEALQAEERAIRAAASAALTFLSPGPDFDVLRQMLTSNEMFVRWQALRMLRGRAYDQPDAFGEAKERLWPLVLDHTLTQAPNPLTRREAVLLVQNAGSATDTPWLIDRLQDPDPDVQLAAIWALNQVGDRHALDALRQVPGKVAFLGRSLKLAAEDAVESIETRHPLPAIKKIILCQHDPRQAGHIRQSSLFMPDVESVYCVVVVDHVQPDTQVAVNWRINDHTLHQEQRAVGLEPEPIAATIQATPIVEDMAQAPESGRRFGHSEPDRPRRHPFGRAHNDDESPRFGRARRTRSFDNGERDAPRRRFGRSPFSERLGDEPEQRPPLARRPERPGSRPTAPRRSSSSRFGRSPSHDRAPSPSRRTQPAQGSAFTRSRPTGRRQTAVDPIENIEQDQPSPQDTPESVNVPFTRRPLPSEGRQTRDRPGGRRPPAPPLAHQTRAPAEDAEIPDWLAELADSNDDDADLDNLPPVPRHDRRETRSRFPEHRRLRPHTPRPTPARAAGDRPPEATRRRFGSRGRDRPIFGRRPNLLADFDPSARFLVFALPRPVAGWSLAQHQLEVTLDASINHTASFRVIDAVQLIGIEPGTRAELDTDFYLSHSFLAHSGYIDCQVHLDDAPIQTPVTGQIYSMTTGALLAETSVQTEKQGRQTVHLSWENTGWKAGPYRIIASTDTGNVLHVEIELVDRITLPNVWICSQVDRDHDPVGSNWPIFAGDRCYCVVDLGSPPPGVELKVAWYSKNRALETVQTQPYVTTGAPQQTASFELIFEDQQDRLTAGHYSAVIDGPHVVREERSFEVQPAPRPTRITAALTAVRHRIMAFLKAYHLDGAVVPVLGMLALGLVFMIGDAALAHSLDGYRQTGDALLRIIQTIGRWRWECGVGWLVAGGVFGMLQARQDHNISTTSIEDQSYTLVNYLLAFTSSALGWYLVTMLLFSAGDLWPRFAWGIFEQLHWLQPPVTWAGIPVALGFTGWLVDDEDPFFTAPGWAVRVAFLVMGVGWIGAFCIGLPVGLLGASVSELLDVIGIGNALGHGSLGVGASGGFIIALLATGYNLVQDDAAKLSSDWKIARRSHSRRPYSLLTFLIEHEILPLQQAEWTELAAIARRGLAVMGVSAVGALLIYPSVVLPALIRLYHLPDQAALDQFLTPIISALMLAAMGGLPVIGYGLYRRALVPLLNAQEAAYVRRFGVVALIGLALSPLIAAVVSRTAIGTDLPPELAIFWTHRVTALVMAVLGAGWLAALLANMPASLKNRLENLDLSLELTAEERVFLGITVLAAILWPAWCWALLLGAVLAAIGGGYYVLRRIE